MTLNRNGMNETTPSVRTQARILTALTFSAFFMNGCIHSYYLPNTHNVPLLTEKKDVRISAGTYQGLQTGFEFQGSYAVTNNIGLMGNAMAVSGTNSYGDSRIRYFDLGCGYFKPLNSHFVFETYAVAGFGSARNTFESGSYNDANFTKLFVQPSIGYKSKFMDLALSFRLASLNFTSLVNTGQIGGTDLTDIQFIQNNSNSFLSEPAITVRFGSDRLKLQGQYGWSFNMSHPEFPQGDKFYYSIGIAVSINAKGKENK